MTREPTAPRVRVAAPGAQCKLFRLAGRDGRAFAAACLHLVWGDFCQAGFVAGLLAPWMMFLCSAEGRFFAPGWAPEGAARSGGQHWPKATARRAAVLTAASTAPALPKPGSAFGIDRQRTEG